MLAQAISSTAPIAPMSTHNMLATPPTRSSFNGPNDGGDSQVRDGFARSAESGRSGHASSQIGNMRSTSARASAGVTPGRSRASP